MLLRDVHQICADILDGAYDDILEGLEQSVAARKKRQKREAGLFKNGLVRTLPDCPEIPNRILRVKSVNKRTLTCVDVKTGTEYRISPSLVESLHAGKAAMEFAGRAK